MNILIFTAATGGGHKRAAAALEAKIHRLDPETNVTVIDALKVIGTLYDKTVCEGYHFMATHIPKVYGLSYKATDKKNIIYNTVSTTNKIISKKLLSAINEHNPDVIVACHPFIASMLSRLKIKDYLNGEKVIALITDYDAHRIYVGKGIDAYVVAEPYIENKLVEKYGVDRSLIYPLGIPIFDEFSDRSFDKKAICEKNDLDPDKPTILLMAGSFGVTSVLEFYKSLVLKGGNENLQYIVITGRNGKLYEQLEKLVNELGAQDNTKLLYFVKNVYDYMHISDLIVTKPGGLTVTESLACHLPLAIYSAFPGQELDNAIFLTNMNAAVLLDKKQGAEEIIELINDKDKLEQMKKICSELAKPNAAEDFFRLTQKLCGINNDKE